MTNQYEREWLQLGDLNAALEVAVGLERERVVAEREALISFLRKPLQISISLTCSE